MDCTIPPALPAGRKLMGNYCLHAGAYDWGCAVDRIRLALSAPLDKVSASDFVLRSRIGSHHHDGRPFQVEEDMTVSSAYLCAADGTKRDAPSSYVTLEIAVEPGKGNPFALSKQMSMTVYAHSYRCFISMAENAALMTGGETVTALEIEPVPADLCTSADMFQLGHYQSTYGISYEYAAFIPAQISETLVVWLHGLGEGAAKLEQGERTDPRIPCLAAKVTALAGEEFQTLMKGAHVLVPQCPTYWMDSDGRCSNWDGKIDADGTSYYTASLHELIASYKARCGAKKVLIAGCSNGGYMGMVLASTYGGEYDGYVLICEAMPDRFLSDAQLERIKDLPLYFIYADNDPLVIPALHEKPTIRRLREMGACRLHVSTTAAVMDRSGLYKNPDGTARQYFGHASWIYFFNNETACDQCSVDVWHWMARQLDQIQ